MVRMLFMLALVVSLPAFAADTDSKTTESSSSLATNDSAEVEGNESDDAEGSQARDQEVLDKEFLGYGSLRERRFGLLVGVGKTVSPRQSFHFELIFAPLKFLRLSLAIDTASETRLEKTKKLSSAAILARHHLTILPLFFGVTAGGAKDSIDDLIDSENATSSATSIYSGLFIGFYYFWNFGLYLETTIAGASYQHVLNKNTAADSATHKRNLEDKLAEGIIGAQLFGLLTGGLNISVGYML
ncbi:MAG: hypothetical protein OYH77_02980 [Pseudomonadota bacterium]|nr:hypothetical protein [Pseudomonadota bacterium]